MPVIFILLTDIKILCSENRTKLHGILAGLFRLLPYGIGMEILVIGFENKFIIFLLLTVIDIVIHQYLQEWHAVAAVTSSDMPH
jgi:hypothetical protein